MYIKITSSTSTKIVYAGRIAQCYCSSLRSLFDCISLAILNVLEGTSICIDRCYYKKLVRVHM